MCKINKKQNAHGVTFRSLWNLGQPRIQEGKAGAKYIQNGSNQIQTRLLVRFFLLLPLSVEDARARRKVDLNYYYYFFIIITTTDDDTITILAVIIIFSVGEITF